MVLALKYLPPGCPLERPGGRTSVPHGQAKGPSPRGRPSSRRSGQKRAKDCAFRATGAPGGVGPMASGSAVDTASEAGHRCRSDGSGETSRMAGSAINISRHDSHSSSSRSLGARRPELNRSEQVSDAARRPQLVHTIGTACVIRYHPACPLVSRVRKYLIMESTLAGRVL